MTHAAVITASWITRNAKVKPTAVVIFVQTCSYLLKSQLTRFTNNSGKSRFIKGGVQWKQGVVIYMMSYYLLYNTTPIPCTPLRLHPLY